MKCFAEKPQVEGWINAGYFVFHRRFFDYLKAGDDCVLEHEPLARAAADGQLVAYRHDGFFFAMDTFREYEALNRCGLPVRPPGRSGNERRRLARPLPAARSSLPDIRASKAPGCRSGCTPWGPRSRAMPWRRPRRPAISMLPASATCWPPTMRPTFATAHACTPRSRRLRPEVVFHLAAQPIVREGYAHPRETFDVNVMGTVNLLEAIRVLGRPCVVLVITSDKCYENREQIWGYREIDALGGHDPYSASKAAAEIAVAAYRRSFFPPGQLQRHGVKLASVRAGNVIGGGDWAKDRIITDVVRHLQAGQPVPVRSPRAIRPWQHVLEPLGGYLTLAARMLAVRRSRVVRRLELRPRAGRGNSRQPACGVVRPGLGQRHLAGRERFASSRTRRACCDCASIKPCINLAGGRGGAWPKPSGGRPSGSAAFMQVLAAGTALEPRCRRRTLKRISRAYETDCSRPAFFPKISTTCSPTRETTGRNCAASGCS